MVTSSIGLPRPAAPAALDQIRTVQPVNHAAPTEETRTPPRAHSQVGTQRKQQNAQILQASVDVSIKSANSSLALLYRTAIDRINEHLSSELGPNAIADTGNPVSTPESTVGRILSMSTAFYGAYAARHKDEDTETVARNFVDLIRGGFERGFGEAQDILSGLGVLEGDSPIAQGLEKTHALLMQGLEDFLATTLSSQSTPPAKDPAVA